MTFEIVKDNALLETVRATVQKHGAKREELIPILNEVNRKVGYLPSAALEEVALLLQVSKSQVFSVATFYQMLSTVETGQHVVVFCESAPCHVAGGVRLGAVERRTPVEAGQTSIDKNGRW
jgi:NADH:ubiquinone oxidoreductase subunit E